MKPYERRKPRYVEPDLENYPLGIHRKICSECGRLLPDHPDFFGIHAVREYRYRRPECRSCRAEMMRDKHAAERIIEEEIVKDITEEIK